MQIFIKYMHKITILNENKEFFYMEIKLKLNRNPWINMIRNKRNYGENKFKSI